jgi:hypothetical protein
MATYKAITAWLKANYGFTAQPCWIADIKSEHGRTTRQAFNRIDPGRKVKPCPDKSRAAIERALRHFGMI